MCLAVFLHRKKTVLTNNIADNICLNGHPVLFFSYDDGRTELRYRTDCRFSGFDIEEFKQSHDISKYLDLEAIYRKNRPRFLPISTTEICGPEDNPKAEDWPQFIDKIYARHIKGPGDHDRLFAEGENREQSVG